MSESLIATVKQLAELDKKIMPGDLNVEYETLTKMLEVLSLFQAGDAEQLRLLRDGYAGWVSSLLTEEDKQMLMRLQKMASLMEGTE